MQLNSLATKIKNKDKDAFATLYELMRKQVYSVCLGIVARHTISEEIMQDTFVAVWNNIESFKGGNFKYWILQIAKNKSLNYLKKQKRETLTTFETGEMYYGAYSIDDNVTLGNLLKSALQKLDPISRQIVLLKTSGVKTKDIATMLSLPRGTVSWKYSEALNTLRKYVKEDD